MENRLFEMSYFLAPITNKVPSRTVTLGEVARMVRSPLWAPQTEQLRGIADKAEARSYKGRNFPYVTPAGVFTYCNDQSMISHSRVLCIDLDHLEDVDRMKQQLIEDAHFQTPLAFRSPSGDGLKWFVLIDLSLADHQTWFQAVRNYLLATYTDLTQENVDAHVGNLSRACFLCYDPDVYVNLDSKEAEMPFDITMWAEKSANVRKPAVAVSCLPTACQPLSPTEELAKAKAVTYALMRRGASIAESYGDYVKLGFSLANGLGSDGRHLYHLLCSQSSKYNSEDCEAKWNECLSKSDGRTTIATFYHMAKMAGVELKDFTNRDY
jgi:hypothetical protein